MADYREGLKILPEHIERTLTGSPDAIITSVRIELRGRHALLTVWHRGANAGKLIVEAKDADVVARRLMGVERCTETP